jgi:hypothetical protein
LASCVSDRMLLADSPFLQVYVGLVNHDCASGSVFVVQRPSLIYLKALLQLF